MAKKMFVYLLFLSMIITIVSFPVNAEETDMPRACLKNILSCSF